MRGRPTLAATPAESFTVMAMVVVPAALGVPPSVPPEERDMPAGKPEADHVYGGVPPTADNVCEYTLTVLAFGRELETTPSTESVTLTEVVTGWLSVSCTANVKRPGWPALPESKPVTLSSESHNGAPLRLHR